MIPGETKKQRLNRMIGGMKQERSSFEAHWKELADYFKPRRARFVVTDVNRGDRRSQKIIDTTPTLAARTLASGMMSGITSPARNWFRLTTPDKRLAENGAVKLWLDEVRQIMMAVLLRSNAYQVLPTLYGDMGVFATGAIAVEEDDETVIRCIPFPIGEYYLANDAKGRVRTFARLYQLTVRQIVEQFGERNAAGEVSNWEKFTPAVKTAWDAQRFDQRVDLAHIIYPNPEYNPNLLDARYKRFASCYFEPGGQTNIILQESGFDEFPVLAGRWDVTAGDVYGTDCPGMTALGDNKQLQFGEKLSAQAIEKMVKPPMVASREMENAALSMLAGNVSYVDETRDQKLRPAQEVNFRVDLLDQKQEKIRQRLDRAFFVDLFLMLQSIDRADITATEIMERKEEKLLALGPMLEQLNQDVLDPFIDRLFAILVRRRLIPTPPQELQGQPLKVEYESVMAQAQRAVGRSGLEAISAFAGNLAKSKEDPSVWDKIDTDQLLDEFGDTTALPPSVIRTDDDVAAIRQQRAQAQAAQQKSEQIAMAAKSARDLASANTGSKNALTDLLGSGSAAA